MRGVLAVSAVTMIIPAVAHGYMTGPAVPLDKLVAQADIVCKGTVTADATVTDKSFETYPAFVVRETTLKIASCIKGTPGKLVKFRHYAPGPPAGTNFTPQNVVLVVGKSYFVFGVKGATGAYRSLAKWPTQKVDADAILAASDKPHTGTTINDAVFAELAALATAAKDPKDAIEGIRQLNELSGGSRTNLADIPRATALATIAAGVSSADPTIARAAIDVFGEDSPYYVPRDAGYWLAGIGKGTISGLGPRTPAKIPSADSAYNQLLGVADAGPPALRALAIRAVGRAANLPTTKVASWLTDPDVGVRAAAVAITGSRADRSALTLAVKDPKPEVRAAAALAIGISQDPKFVTLLGPLLADTARDVHQLAAMSLLSFELAIAKPVLVAALTTDYRSIFVNVLAAVDPKPYLTVLGQIIASDERPADWWGGSIPAGDSWRILFKYVKSATGNLDAHYAALEAMRWYSSSEPRDLYALYVSRKLTARAKAFRAANIKAVGDMTQFFDEVDKDPSPFLH